MNAWKISALVVLLTASSEAKTYRIEKDYSIIEFRIRHLVSVVRGHFADFEGTLDYDPAKPEGAKVDVEIRPASIDTRNKQRDKHLRNKDFFDVAKYPTARYVSQSIERREPNVLRVDGSLTLHGETRPVPLEITLRGATVDFLGRSRAGFLAKGTFNRKDFGITWNETFEGGLLLGDDVDIEIEIDAVEKEPPK